MALGPHVNVDTAALWARQTAATIMRRLAARIAGAVGRWPARRSRRQREATKSQIIRFMQGAGGHSAAVALTSRASIAWALQLAVDELQPLLDELVAEGRIFLCEAPLPPDHYSLSKWRPDWSLLR